MHQTENLKMQLSDLLHRYESAFTVQQQGYQDFKSTAAQAGTLLGSLQASADSLKEMVRYEVGRAGSTEKKEVDELRERVRKLEEKLGEK
jgi:polyhydroxyalkanoate synthesis regulator phasin